MTTTRTPRYYDEDFKSRAVGMVLDGLGVNAVAADLGIPRSGLQRWKRRASAGAGRWVPVGGRSASDLAADNERLRRELADVRSSATY